MTTYGLSSFFKPCLRRYANTYLVSIYNFLRLLLQFLNLVPQLLDLPLRDVALLLCGQLQVPVHAAPLGLGPLAHDPVVVRGLAGRGRGNGGGARDNVGLHPLEVLVEHGGLIVEDFISMAGWLVGRDNENKQNVEMVALYYWL